jgi:hypothetical protein
MLRISLDAQIEDLEQLFETAHLNYLQQTAQRTHDFKELTHKDQGLDVDINSKKKKIDNLQVLLLSAPFLHPSCILTKVRFRFYHFLGHDKALAV